tara:strand:- start:309 stop:695 length:387 start_codon:yes stop_codon:yes gene_type:complete
MNKSELKTILKPLIKQCIKECIFEEGVLSGLITEVAKGLSAGVVLENKQLEASEQALEKKRQEYEKDRQERIRKLNESSKLQAPAFENTQQTVESSGQSALSGQDPHDPGVDISGILNVANGRWKKLI